MKILGENLVINRTVAAVQLKRPGGHASYEGPELAMEMKSGSLSAGFVPDSEKCHWVP